MQTTKKFEIVVDVLDASSGATQRVRAFPAGSVESPDGRARMLFTAAVSAPTDLDKNAMHWVTIAITGEVARVAGGAKRPGDKFALDPVFQVDVPLVADRGQAQYTVRGRFQLLVSVAPKAAPRPSAPPARPSSPPKAHRPSELDELLRSLDPPSKTASDEEKPATRARPARREPEGGVRGLLRRLRWTS